MSDVILETVANDLSKITEQIELAKNRVQFLKGTGEDVSKMEADIRNLEIKRDKWKRQLEEYGYTVK